MAKPKYGTAGEKVEFRLPPEYIEEGERQAAENGVKSAALEAQRVLLRRWKPKRLAKKQ